MIFVLLLASFTRTDAAEMRDVVFVANGEGGTVDLIDADTLELVRSLNVIPDGESPDPAEDPEQAIAFPLVVGAAGDNFAQDLDVSPDGTTLYVSRGHRGDVAALDIASGNLLWRVSIDGFRADHMTISADGARLFVSAITANIVQVIDTETGEIIGSFPTGEWPHDNLLSPDGARVYNGSIGNVLLPEELRERPEGLSAVYPPPYAVTVTDAATLEVVRTIPFEAGVRPFVITSGEERLYAQLSELHGLIEVDIATGEELRRLELPIDDGVTSDDYDFEAPHHGLALSGDESQLCIAGRASDYVALVDTATMQAAAIIDVDDAPGWAATSPDGRHCYVANTRADTVAVVSFDTLDLVTTIPVGDGPKYVTAATVPASVLAS